MTRFAHTNLGSEFEFAYEPRTRRHQYVVLFPRKFIKIPPCEVDLQHLEERLYDFLQHLRPLLAVFSMFRLHNCLLCVKMHLKVCD